MVYGFIGKLIQVQQALCVVFIILLLTDCMCAFNIAHLLNSNNVNSEECNKCKKENRELALQLERKRGNTQRNSCILWKKFLHCAEPLDLANKCRHDIHFQGSLTLMRSFTAKYNCGNMNITWTEIYGIINKVKRLDHLDVEPERKQCRRPKLKPVYKVCGLFGDPHLRTFSDKRHTCSVPGAWPLFANRYLTVQVTNIPLENSSRATATSKVTVIVRGLKRKCIEEKTYQARSFSLPNTFSDGTKSSNDEKCPTKVIREKRRRVRITICPLKTEIIIRQVGKYLTVHMKVPKDLTRRKAIGLCQRGCPRIEQMNLDKKSRIDNVIASFYKEKKPTGRIKRQRQERARKLCGEAKVRGFYYKSCLFDMLTSDDPSFVKAARKAMKDFRAINKDDNGRPIVNETARDFWTGPIKTRTTSRTTMSNTIVEPSSSAFIVHKSSFSVLIFIMVLHVFR